jgi:hypothetical protein
MRKKILRISLIIGLFLFLFVFFKSGPVQIWEYIKKLTWQNFLILFVLRFFYYLLRTLNWKIIFEKYEPRVSFFQLFLARIAGDSISYITPSAQIGGEPVRAMMVSSLNTRKSFASVIVDKTIEVFTTIFFIIIGVAIALYRITMARQYQFLFVAFLIASIFFGILLFFRQKQGFIMGFINTLERMKIRFKFIVKNKLKIEEIDDHISDFYRNHRKRFLVVFLLYSFTFLFWTAEIYLALVFMNVDGINFLTSFLILTLGSLVILIPTIPASLGIYEATYGTIFVLLGLGADVGISLTLIRRILVFIWVGMGLLAILKNQKEISL